MARSGKKLSATTGPGATGEDALTFEQAVERLEKIIAQIESGEIGLEQSIAEYEKGVGLIRRCREILDQAEQRVKQLSVPGAGAKAKAPPELEAEGDDAPF